MKKMKEIIIRRNEEEKETAKIKYTRKVRRNRKELRQKAYKTKKKEV